MTIEPKIPGAVIPRGVFTQSGSFSSDQPAPDALGMSAAPPIAPEIVHCSEFDEECHKRTDAPQQELFDHLVGQREQLVGNG